MFRRQQKNVSSVRKDVSRFGKRCVVGWQKLYPATSFTTTKHHTASTKVLKSAYERCLVRRRMYILPGWSCSVLQSSRLDGTGTCPSRCGCLALHRSRESQSLVEGVKWSVTLRKRRNLPVLSIRLLLNPAKLA